MTFDSAAAKGLAKERLEEVKKKYEVLECSICYNPVIPEFDAHCMVKGEECGHVFHAKCFHQYYQKKYLLEEMSENFMHMFVPVIVCPNCKILCGFFIPHNMKRVPDGV
jgi:serine acetyltransferase